MLTNIYARSMLTATRHDCVRLRDFPRSAKQQQTIPSPSTPSEKQAHGFARLDRLNKSFIRWVTSKVHPIQRPVQCIDIQKL